MAETENQNQQQPQQRPADQPHFPMNFIRSKPLELLCFVLRLATIYFAFNYTLNFASPAAQKTIYIRAFATAAATSAFRLHQRMQSSNIPLVSLQFLAQLSLEDSAHYLFYCLLLSSTTPISVALLPITLYAAYHALTYIIQFMHESNWRPELAARLHSLKMHNQSHILGTIAYAEMLLLPLLIAMVFTGKAQLFVPFVHSQFLRMRCMSRRNPHTRAMFGQLRTFILSLSNHQQCPSLVRSILHKTVALVELMAPPHV